MPVERSRPIDDSAICVKCGNKKGLESFREQVKQLTMSVSEGLGTRELEWLKELNPDQLKAVCHREGPVLVVAGAGSGKTRTLSYRVAYLIANGVDPGRILLLTFSRRAAKEMLRRAETIVARGIPKKGRVWGGTFHSVANRLLRIYAQSAGLRTDFTVMDRGDAEDLMDVVRHKLDLDSREKRFPRKRTCLAIYSSYVNGNQSLSDIVDFHFPWCNQWENVLKELFLGYVCRKQKDNVLDFDDLLLYLANLLSPEAMADQIGSRFDHVLVDEYQDTNLLQATILRRLRRKNRNIMVVGDDSQSIYSFRGATVANMFDFPTHFKGTTVFTLEQNYRSVSPILEVANYLIAEAKETYSKNLWSTRSSDQLPFLVTCPDETSQDEYLVKRVLEHYEQGIPLRRQAVLFRAAHLSNSLELELSHCGISFHKYGGLKFLETAHIKDLLGFLRIAENPRDEIAWFRTLQLIDGIGPATTAKILAHVGENGYDPTSIDRFPAPLAARETVGNFARLFGDLRSHSGGPARDIERARRTYEPFLERYENPVPRLHDLENLEQVASRYPSRSRFLVDLQLDPPTSTSDLAGPPMKDEDCLVLSTIHSAKGCEWDVVYVIHAADGCLPSDMSTGSDKEIEEERRLAYVAMTRARDFLYVTWPLRYYTRWHAHSDRYGYAQLCRFFSTKVQELMDRTTVKLESPEDKECKLTGTVDIGARIRAMFETE